MKTKTLSLFALSIFAVVLFAGLASADTLAEWTLTTDGTASNVDTHVTASGLSAGSGITTLVNDITDGATASQWDMALNSNKYYQVSLAAKSGYNYSVSTISFDYLVAATGTDTLSLQWAKDSAFTSPVTIENIPLTTDGASHAYTKTISGISIDELETGYFRLYGYGADADNTAVTLSIKNLKIDGTSSHIASFCEYGTKNDSELDFSVDIKNSGDDDDIWLPLNTVEVEVKLENDYDTDGDNDLEDVVFELGLFKEGSTTNIADEMIWISNDEESFEFGDIDEGAKGTHTFIFRIDPESVEDGKYILMVKAYPDGEENNYCIDYSDDLSSFGSSEYYAEISIEKQSDKGKMVVVDVDAFPTPLEVSCGSEVTIYPVIFNIGDEDFPDQIKVSLYNTELGINMEQVILGDLDAGDNTETAFTFAIPADADEKSYTFHMTTYYDYDEDDETYDEISEDDFTFYLTIKEGTCIVSEPADVSAKVLSGGKAGEPLSISVSVTNTGSKTAEYSVSATDYSSWASSAVEEPLKITLDAGEEGEFTVTLEVLKDVSGEQEFELEIYSGGKLVATQPVIVPPIEKSGFSFLTGNLISGDGSLWGAIAIGAFILVVIVAIIIVMVSARRKKA